MAWDKDNANDTTTAFRHSKEIALYYKNKK